MEYLRVLDGTTYVSLINSQNVRIEFKMYNKRIATVLKYPLISYFPNKFNE